MFGVFFPERSYPIDVSAFAQIDPLHWLLDLSPLLASAAGPTSPEEIRELCIFLLTPASLPPGKAMAVYLQPPGGRPFVFCGAVHSARPSAVFSLPWPDPAEEEASPMAVFSPEPARIGVSVEDLAALPVVADAGREKKAEKMALRVGENLFNFMQSFCGVDGSKLVVPMDILDRWFRKFQERSRKDPGYLKSFSL